MSVTRSKEAWASIFAVSASALFLLASFWNTDTEVYLFPRIIALLMAVLALFQTIGWWQNRQHDLSSNNIPWRGILPGLILAIIFVVVIETTGFYIGSFVAFVGITLLYGKRHLTDPKALLVKVAVGVVFMLVLYGLFWKLLYVRTPAGWLF